jgi:hypothetical protein
MDKVDAIYCALLASSGGSNPFDQDLNTTDNVAFNDVALTGGLTTGALSTGNLIFTTVGAGVDNPIPDGDYTVGIGGSTNGVITTRNGIITNIQEATP